MNRVYIAAPIFNKKQLEIVSAITMMVKLQEWQYFSPHEASNSIWKGRAPKDCTPEERSQVLLGNIEHLHWTEVLLAWVGGTEDGRTDTGVVWEMGYFKALAKYAVDLETPVIPPPKFTLAYVHPSDLRQSMNLMLAGTVDALAYGPAQLDKAMQALRYGDINHVRERFAPEQHILHEKEPIA